MGLKWETLPEDELILLVQKGSGEAFVELASRYLPLIHRMASPYRSSFLEAEDLSQEGLLGLFAAAGGYRRDRGTSFSAYAAACISNRILSAYRKACSKKMRRCGNLSPWKRKRPRSRSLFSGTRKPC